MKNFIQRLALSSLFSVILLLVLYFSNLPIVQPIFVAVAMLISTLALWEYYQISRKSGSEPAIKLGILGSIIYFLVVYLTPTDGSLITLFAILFVTFISYFFSGASPFSNLALTFFGLIYLTIPLSLFIPINLMFGRYWLFYLLMVTKFTDIGAYFIGKKWGKTPLAPIISPKKTWEGAIGGAIVGILISVLLDKIYLWNFGQPLFSSIWESILLGTLISVVAQIGDLAESLLKRDRGVKDSNTLPGLGGFLDIVDSLVFTTPLLYFFLKLKLG